MSKHIAKELERNIIFTKWKSTFIFLSIVSSYFCLSFREEHTY